jgi:hypothetical protein
MPDEKNPDDIDTLGEDHMADAIRYALVHVLPMSRKVHQDKKYAPGSFGYLLGKGTAKEEHDLKLFDTIGFLN